MDVETLTAQLETLGRSFEFVSRDDVLAAVDGEAPLPDRACLVTFDDGLRSQHDIALPVLERLGVPAVFFVSGKPLVEARALTVHKLHAVREAVGDAELARRLESCGLEIDDDAALEHYRYDDVVAARVKYALNALLSPDQAAAIVDATFTDLHGDEAHFCNELYMSPADVAQLERRHAAVGSHGYAHRPLARLDRDARREDLRAGVAALEEVLGSSPRVLSYPYGTRSAVDADTARDAAAAGFRAAFTAERALNATLAEPCLLARFDANDVPGGRRPLLELDNEPRVLPGATGARTLYFDEAAA